MEVKILHMADVHFDAAFSSMSITEAEKCRAGLRSAFAAAVLSAKNRGVQLFFIAGDLFDGERLSAATEEFLVGQTERYADCQFFIAPGNHDPYNEASPYKKLRFPKNVHVFRGREKIELAELGVDVYGFGFTEKYCKESPVTGYGKLNKDRINILVCHGDTAQGDYGPITAAEIAASGFDYIALGHIHAASGVLESGGVHYAYPGCIQGRGMDETGVKGALCGSVGKGKVDLEFLPLSRRKYEILSFEVGAEESRKDLLSRMTAPLLKMDGDTVVRVILTGETAEPLLIDAQSVKENSDTLAEIELKDKTTLAVNMAAPEAENTLRGVFARRMLNAAQTEDSEEREAALLAYKLGLEALAGRVSSGD